MSFDTGGHQSHEPGSHAARQRQIDRSRTELLGGPSAQTGRPHHADQSAETATPVAQEGYLIIAQVKRGHFGAARKTRCNEEKIGQSSSLRSYASSPPLRTCDNCKKYDPWRKNPLSLSCSVFPTASSFVQLDPSRRLPLRRARGGREGPTLGGHRPDRSLTEIYVLEFIR